MAPNKKDARGTKAGKGGDKAKGKGGASKDRESGVSSKLKAATAINTRHILVCIRLQSGPIGWLR